MTPTPLIDNYVGIQLPDDAISAEVRTAILCYDRGLVTGFISIPPARYKFICLSEEATEEDAGKIVPRYDGDYAWIPTYNDPDSGGHGFSFDDYENDDEHSVYYTALESLRSLLKSKQLSGNVAILEILK